MDETTNMEVQEVQPTAAPVEKEDFESLIRGKYKQQFDARVRKILEGRLKSLHRENALLRSEANERQLRLAAQEEEMERAYGAFDTMLRRAVRYGAERAGQDLSRSLSGGRIAENGGGGRAAAVTTVDPKRLSRAEREDIRRRVARGEKVKFS